MTSLLTRLLAAIPAGPWVQVAIHIGPSYVANTLGAADDECECDCGDELDLHEITGVTVYPLPEPMLRELLEEVATCRGNGASTAEAVDHGIATLLLANIEATGPEA